MSDEASEPFEIQHCRCQNDTFVVQKFPKGADGQYLYQVVCSKCDKQFAQFKDAKLNSKNFKPLMNMGHI